MWVASASKEDTYTALKASLNRFEGIKLTMSWVKSMRMSDVGMPCLHPHPKNLFAFTPCPFPVWVLSTHFSASATRPLPLLAPVVCMHCTCNAKLNYGAHGLQDHGPFTIITTIIFFGERARNGRPVPFPYNRALGRSHCPHPPPADLKGRLWRGMG